MILSSSTVFWTELFFVSSQKLLGNFYPHPGLPCPKEMPDTELSTSLTSPEYLITYVHTLCFALSGACG